MNKRVRWSEGSQESNVEKFYSQNAKQFSDVHGGYLNFGLWESGVTDYVSAAENMVHRLGSMLRLRPGDRVLDVACGTGAQDFYLNRKFGPIEIDAVDVTWPHVERARLSAIRQNISEQVRFHHGSGTRLKFPAKSFNHVLCIEGAEHFDTRMKFLREAQRVLVPGGRIALADYVIKRPPANRVEKMILDAAIALWKIPPANAVTAKRYAMNLEKAGFENPWVRQIGEFTFPGYYLEQRRASFRLHKIRTQGFVVGGLGFVIDIACYQAYRLGLVDYVLASAQRPRT